MFQTAARMNNSGFNRLQQDNGYGGLFDLVGSVLGQAQANKREAGVMQGGIDYQQQMANDGLYNPAQGDMANQSNPQSDYLGSNTDQQTAQSLMPTGFQTQVPTANNVGQGLIGQQPTTTNGQQVPQQQFFANPAQTADGTAPTINANQDLGKYSKVNNPVAVEGSAMTPQQAQAHVNMMQSQAALVLQKKYGPAAMQQIMPMLQQASNEKLAGFNQDYNNTKIQGLITTFNDPKTTDNQKMWLAAQAKQLYKIDIGNEAKNFLVNPTDKLTQDNKMAIHNTASGDTIANNGEKRYQWDNTSANNVNDNNTKVTTTGMNNDASRYATDSRSSSSRYSADHRATKSGSAKATAQEKYLGSMQGLTDVQTMKGYYEKVANDEPIFPSDQAKYDKTAAKLNAAGWNPDEG